MEVIVAEHAGFCFGVTKAVDTVYEQIAKKSDGENHFNCCTFLIFDGFQSEKSVPKVM